MMMANNERPYGDPIKTETSGGETVRGEFFRYGATLPIAAGVTIGLMVSMAALVATEFTPQDKTETATFEINPVVEDLPDHVRELKIDPLKKIEVPPPPTPLDITKTAEVKVPVHELTGKKIEFDIEDMDLGLDFETVAIDREDPTPLVRIPPVFPNRFLQGDVSGYCRVRFDVNSDGQPFNVTATLCTNSQLKSPTVKSVQGWKYAPKMQNGAAVSRPGLETTIRFDLKDERGEVLPVPHGY